MSGKGIGQESDVSRATGEVDDNSLPILVLKDIVSNMFGASYVSAAGGAAFALQFFCGRDTVRSSTRATSSTSLCC